MLSIMRVYEQDGLWYVSGNSEVFETREEALKRVTTQRTKQGNKNKNTKYFSERFGINFRSTWEDELANVLADLGIQFEYEIKRFYFRNHNESYLPDFYLPEYNTWIEVKGYFDKRSQKRCKLFKKYHGHEYGFLLWMADDRKLTLKTPEIIYTYLNIAEEERLRSEKRL